ncbi:MAG TPA: ABC transporter ATP-binding protein [Baekduia sp.]|nr:ABC transporter ATP-binding protein [Baekduia sp.]
MTEPAALVLEGLTKRYGDRTAVEDVSLAIPSGAVAGFIGPNGAGKTTTMAMLLGLVRPSAGTATVLGESIRHPDRYLHRVGALLEGPALWPSLTGHENLVALARLGGHDAGQIPEILELVGLGERGDDRFGRYSLGMKQRLGIAAALLGDPELLVLDEPTNGLDPVGMREMRALISRVAQQGTVIVSSHVLSELEQICDWLIVIDAGRIAYNGSADAFSVAGHAEIAVCPISAADLEAVARIADALGVAFEQRGDGLVVRTEGGDPRALAAELNRAAATAGVVLAEIHVRRPTLESTYLRSLERAAS